MKIQTYKENFNKVAKLSMFANEFVNAINTAASEGKINSLWASEAKKPERIFSIDFAGLEDAIKSKDTPNKKVFNELLKFLADSNLRLANQNPKGELSKMVPPTDDTEELEETATSRGYLNIAKFIPQSKL